MAAEIARTVAALGLSRFTMKYSAGTLPHGQLMQSIELFGTEVVPQVRALVAGDEPRRERDEVSSGG